jgi:hypothetical protein
LVGRLRQTARPARWPPPCGQTPPEGSRHPAVHRNQTAVGRVLTVEGAGSGLGQTPCLNPELRLGLVPGVAALEHAQGEAWQVRKGFSTGCQSTFNSGFFSPNSLLINVLRLNLTRMTSRVG